MFKDIISRDGGTPWPPSGMTTEKWLSVPLAEVRIRDLIATQPNILLAALKADHIPYSTDPYPHVIRWNGNDYLEDGHHRTMRAALEGRKRIRARILTIN